MKLMMYRRRLMTLIEVLIASSLLTVLLAALLGVYYHVTYSYGEVQKTHQEAFQRRYMQNRLTQLFSGLSETYQTNMITFCFTSNDTQDTVGKSLIFTQDCPLDDFPRLSGYTIGRLYVNGEHQLCLATWPGAEWRKHQAEIASWEMKNEVLLDHVQTISFNFYAPPAANPSQRSQVGTTLLNDSWDNQEWPKEYRKFPAMIRLCVKSTRHAQPFEYHFVLPHTNSYIVYKG